MILTLLTLLLLFNLSISLEFPPYIFVGGSFRAVYGNAVGDVDFNPIASQHIAAFVMAIDEFNNHTDGVYDQLLQNTYVAMAVDLGQNLVQSKVINSFFEGASAGYYPYTQSPFGTLLGVVGTSNDISTSSLLQTLGGWEISVFVTNSSSTGFSHPESYPLMIRILPADSYSGIALYRVLNAQSWNKIAIVYTSDSYGTDCYEVFQYVIANYLDHDITFLAVESFNILTTDLSTILEALEVTGATIFVLFMEENYTLHFLEQGYDYGLLKDGTQVIASQFTSTIADLLNQGYTMSRLTELFSGFITVQNAPELYFQLPQGKEFIERYRKLPATKVFNSTTNTFDCSNRTDDSSGQVPLYNYIGNKPYHNDTCIGIESFESFAEDGSNLDPKILYTYTAAQTIMFASYVLTITGFPLTGKSVQDFYSNSTLFYQVYESAAGNLTTLSSGIEAANFLTKGDRMQGHIFKINNFNSNKLKFVTVGTIDDHDGAQFCDTLNYNLTCYNPQYRQTIDSVDVKPSDTQPNIYKTTLNSVKIVFLFFGSFVLIETIIIELFFTVNRHTKTIKTSQFYIISVVAFSGLFGGIRIILSGFDPTLGVCIGRFWTEHIAFRLLIGTLMLKLWRIHAVVNAAALKRIKITEIDVLYFIAKHFIMLLIVLVLITGIGQPQVADYVTHGANQLTIQSFCRDSSTTSGTILLTILYITEALYIIWTLYFLYQTRSVPSSINETAILGPGLFFYNIN